MEQWVPFQKGEYLVDRAFLKAKDGFAVILEGAVIEVYLDSRNQRKIKGSGMVRPILIVQLLEENDDLDLALDLGAEFKYLMKQPTIHAGKVFSSDISSIIQFYPAIPWEQMSETEFDKMISQLKIIT